MSIQPPPALAVEFAAVPDERQERTVIEADGGGHDGVAVALHGRLFTDPPDVLPGHAAVRGACAEGPAFTAIVFLRCGEDVHIELAVHDVVCAREDARAAEVRKVVGAIPCSAAVGAVVVRALL
jgi:hypothetical protein